MRYTLRGARLLDATTDYCADIRVEGTSIQAIASSLDDAHPIVDVSDMLITPGFIDVHTHGGGGYNLHTTDAEEIVAYANWVTTTGVTAFLVGIVGVFGALPEAQLRTAVKAMRQCTSGAEPLGIHLEGPYISSARRGAHAPAWLRLPNTGETERLLALTEGTLKIVTLAPELPDASAMIHRLVDAGVTVSIGHTDATYEQAREAIRLGATHATHCFNAMRPLQHREPGPLGAIAEASQVRGELIADGVHVHPAIMDVLIKMLGPERTIIITDALSAAGCPCTSFEFAGQSASVINGAARLADGTMAGSVLTMEQALRNILHMTHISLREAVGMLTLNPAQAIGVASHKGRLQAGYDADLLIFDASLTLQATICRGKVTFVTDAWRERLSAHC